ncbi:hypothetical protein [Streptomyces sp. NPDC057293]|uniref:hypothetical protein n=1 Tax=unclassified Streptomyces TaxID=2593676 RepID=UPI0036323795
MSTRPLLCTRCRSQVGVVEDVESCIDWGPAVVDEGGVVQPGYPNAEDNHQEVAPAMRTLRIRAYCVNPECGHQWTIRRRFDTST